jgi:hypothetical protein
MLVREEEQQQCANCGRGGLVNGRQVPYNEQVMVLHPLFFSMGTAHRGHTRTSSMFLLA